MKRSEINKTISWAKGLLEENNIKLPMFGYWNCEEWKENRDKVDTIKKVMLGWDITDYGAGDFDNFGATLFTIRNGSLKDSSVGVPYAEKLIILKDGQKLPNHYHASKTEDIINKAGGVLAIEMYNKKEDGTVDFENDVTIELDGVKRVVKAGEEIHVLPGCSITLRPFQFHRFWAKEGMGDLILGEVSSINDDNTDNYNADDIARFSTIEEDEAIEHPLCNEYSKVLGE